MVGYSRFLFSWAKLYSLSLEEILGQSSYRLPALLILSFDTKGLNKRYCRVVSPAADWADQEVACLAYPNVIAASHNPDKSDHHVFFTKEKYGTAWTALPIKYARYFQGLPLIVVNEDARA